MLSVGKQNAIRLRAPILLLRYSGLRLGDAVTISRDRINNGTLILRTEKTGTLVRLPLPQKVVDAIAACPGPRYPFWSGNGKRKSVVTDWQRALKTLFDIAGVRGAHAHRFRHTPAFSLLLAGVSLTHVSKLLGHSSEAITEKYYSPRWWRRGELEYSGILKTRKLLILRNAKNVGDGKMAVNWNVSGT